MIVEYNGQYVFLGNFEYKSCRGRRTESEAVRMNPIQPTGPQRILRPDPSLAPKAPNPAHKPLDPAQPPAGQDPAGPLRQNLIRLLAELDRILSAYSKQPARAYVALDTLRKEEIFALTQPERFTQSRDVEEARAIHLKFEQFFRECAHALTPTELEQARLCAAYLQDLTRTARGFQEFLLEQAQSDPVQRARVRSEFIRRMRGQNRSKRNVTIALTLLAMLLSFLTLPGGIAFAISVVLGAVALGCYWFLLRQPVPSEDPGNEAGDGTAIEDPILRERMEIIRQVMGDGFADGARPFLLGPGETH